MIVSEGEEREMVVMGVMKVVVEEMERGDKRGCKGRC